MAGSGIKSIRGGNWGDNADYWPLVTSLYPLCQWVKGHTLVTGHFTPPFGPRGQRSCPGSLLGSEVIILLWLVVTSPLPFVQGSEVTPQRSHVQKWVGSRVIGLCGPGWKVRGKWSPWGWVVGIMGHLGGEGVSFVRKGWWSYRDGMMRCEIGTAASSCNAAILCYIAVMGRSKE